MNSIVERMSLYISPVPESGCWIWSRSDSCRGYGRIRVNGKDVMAHKAMYEAVKWKVPKGLQLDHLCRVRCCVNPDHLEPVTQSENAKRGLTGKHKRPDVCRKGHVYAETGVYINAKGHRHCAECRKINSRNFRAKNHE